jgi:hypothetical protein
MFRCNIKGLSGLSGNPIAMGNDTADYVLTYAMLTQKVWGLYTVVLWILLKINIMK